MEYKVGDIVKLRDDLEIDKVYGNTVFTVLTHGLKHQGLKIIKVGTDYYIIEGKNKRIAYASDEMIEGLWEECKPKLKLIDILNKIANGELKEGTKFIYRNNVYKWKDNMILNTSNLEPFDIADRSDLNMELELIEPQEPTECEHEWREWSLGNRFQVTHYRKCDKCGLEEETEYNHFTDVGKMAEHFREDTKMIEPTDNTKIEELDIDSCGLRNEYNSQGDVYARGFSIEIFREEIIDKLNEVIRYINK